jgi:hypothetical protein
MLIIAPISRADLSLAIPLAEHIHFLGGVARHDLVLFPAGEEAMDAARKMSKILDKDFASVTIQECENPDETGWPKSANVTFRKAFYWVENKSGYKGPVYFFELDNVPLRSTWADELQDAYIMSGKLCLGHIHSTQWTFPNGTTEKRGVHMVGTGIYTVPISSYSRLWRHAGTVNTAFDVFLCNEVVPNAAHTDLIQHNWSTENYRRSNGKIVCSANNARQGALVAPVDPKAAVLHGCKDGSLFPLFRKTQKGDTE